MKSYISRVKPKNVHYGSYRNFNEEKFLSDVRERIFLLKQVILRRTIQYQQMFSQIFLKYMRP